MQYVRRNRALKPTAHRQGQNLIVPEDAHPDFSFYHVVYPVDEVLTSCLHKMLELRL